MSFAQKRSVYSYFLIINIFFSVLLAIRYFLFLPEFPKDVMGAVFIITSLIGQMALLGGIVGGVAFSLIFLPKRIFYHSISVIATLILFLLAVDTVVFAQYRFHINVVVLKLVLSKDVVDFSLYTCFLAVVGITVIFLAECWLLHILDTKPIIRFKKKYVVYSFIACFLVSNFIHIWAAARVYQPVLVSKSYLPLFEPATANNLLKKYGLINEEVIEQHKRLAFKISSNLHYPIRSLEKETVDKPVNIMFLVVDSWRFDTFNADNTPNLWSFAKNGVSLQQHISTGNATRTGIFGLFYGLPGTYWQSMFNNQRSALMVDRLQELGYEMGIFTSASLANPEFNQTVFANIDNLRLRSEGETPSQRDANLTKDWLEWYHHRDKTKPVFSFLFYDSPHGYDFPVNYDKKYLPISEEVNYLALDEDTDPIPLMNRYKTSVRYVDDLAKQVLDELKASGDLDNTLVIITGDHAQEINDNKLNYWGHNSNFTQAQTHVPFALVGPQVDKAKQNEIDAVMTSHEDVVPTLMKHYLGIKNPITDYANGMDLYRDIHRNWVLSSNYSSYAIITEDSIFEVDAKGQYEIYDKTNRVKKGMKPNYPYLDGLLHNASRFKK